MYFSLPSHLFLPEWSPLALSSEAPILPLYLLWLGLGSTQLDSPNVRRRGQLQRSAAIQSPLWDHTSTQMHRALSKGTQSLSDLRAVVYSWLLVRTCTWWLKTRGGTRLSKSFMKGVRHIQIWTKLWNSYATAISRSDILCSPSRNRTSGI